MSSDSFEFFPDSALQKEEKINFHFEEIDFQLEQAEKLSDWLIQVIDSYDNELKALLYFIKQPFLLTHKSFKVLLFVDF